MAGFQLQLHLRQSMEKITLTTINTFLFNPPSHLQSFFMLNESWMMFSKQNEIKEYLRKETLQWLWLGPERKLQRFHRWHKCTKKQKALLGKGNEGHKGVLVSITNLFVVLAERYFLPFCLISLCTESKVDEGMGFLSNSSLPWSMSVANFIFKCNFQGKLQLLKLASHQPVLLRIKDKIRSRLWSAEH